MTVSAISNGLYTIFNHKTVFIKLGHIFIKAGIFCGGIFTNKISNPIILCLHFIKNISHVEYNIHNLLSK